MDRATLARPLEDAERQVAQRKDYIAKQAAVIAELGRDGMVRRSPGVAGYLPGSQALHEQHRGWLSEMAARP